MTKLHNKKNLKEFETGTKNTKNLDFFLTYNIQVIQKLETTYNSNDIMVYNSTFYSSVSTKWSTF